MKSGMVQTGFPSRSWWILGGISLILLLTLGLMEWQYRHDRMARKVLFREKIRIGELAERAKDLEAFMGNLHETARTISLLPGVRALRQADPTRSAKDSGQLGADASQAIQQIYNNIAARQVSEIYLVPIGFDPDKGHVPAFMFDDLILDGRRPGAAAARDPRGPDAPENEETEEYRSFPVSMAHWREHFGTWKFRKFEEIPSVLSPTLRTCDNRQYPSVSGGNSSNAQGLVLSVPCYRLDGDLGGQVVVVLLRNVLEAHLCGLADLPVDASGNPMVSNRADPVSPFLLEDPDRGTRIWDRRAGGVHASFDSRTREPQGWVSRPIAMADRSPWRLHRRISPDEEREALAADTRFHELRRGSLLALLVLVISGGSVWNHRRGRQRRHLEEMKARESAKTRRVEELLSAVTVNVTATRPVMESMARGMEEARETLHGMATALEKVRENAGTESRVVTETARIRDEEGREVARGIANLDEMSDALARFGATMEDQGRGIQSLAATTGDMDRSVRQVAEGTQGASNILERLGTTTGHGEMRMREAMAGMAEVVKAVGRIDAFLKLISDITQKTNLLAMNASIEAAHAGAAGAGFSVVAQEIRNLARQTKSEAESVRSVLSLIQEGIRSLETGLEGAGKELIGVVTEAREAAKAMVQLRESVEQASRQGREVDEVVALVTRANQSVAQGYVKLQEQIADLHRVFQQVSRASERSSEHMAEVTRANGDTQASLQELQVTHRHLTEATGRAIAWARDGKDQVDRLAKEIASESPERPVLPDRSGDRT